MITVMSVDIRFIRVMISTTNTFRLCALGAIDEDDITAFFKVFRKTDTGVFLKNTRKIAFGNLKMLCRT